MTGEDLAVKLTKDFAGKGDACRDDIELMGDSLLASFGLDMDKPTDKPDLQRGYEGASRFLQQVCEAFEDPTHVIRIAPFAHAYLGTENFNAALDVVLERAGKHKDEQDVLDQVLSGAALVGPERRDLFLYSVMEADTISDDFTGLDWLISDADPKVEFTTPDEFPAEIQTHDVNEAMLRIGRFIEVGIFQPGGRLGEAYQRFVSRMQGTDYLFKNPSDAHAVVITPDKKLKFSQVRGTVNLEFTPEYDIRPQSTQENPGIVLVNSAVSAEEVRRLYDSSTVVHVAFSKEEREAFAELAVDRESVIDLSIQAFPEETIGAHLKYIVAKRNEGITGLGEMVKADVAKAKELATAGNDHFYDVRDQLEDIGRRSAVDAMVAANNLTLPTRTDNNLVVLLSKGKRNLTPYFDGITRKKVRSYTSLPPIEETGMPFVIITNQAVAESSIQEQFPSATVLYFARNDKEEAAIWKANGENVPFVVNGKAIKDSYKGWGRLDDRSVGIKVTEMFFDPIAMARGEGKTNMSDIVAGISDGIKAKRDAILFKEHIGSFYGPAADYWRAQQQFSASPLVTQLSDGVLMESCPTGGCFEMKQPDTGGCCGGGNLPGVLVDFAVAYRKQVGEERFLAELTAFHDGKAVEPWYTRDRGYQRVFIGIPKPGQAAPEVDDMVF